MADDAGVVRFTVNRWNHFYMCRACRNHLVTDQNSEVISDKIHCEEVLNVKVDNVIGEDIWDFHRTDMANMACKICDLGLGYKVYSYTPRKVGRFTVYDQHESFQLEREAVLFWNGHQVLYADTWEPVEDNPNI